MQQERPFVDNRIYDCTEYLRWDICDASGYMFVVSVLWVLSWNTTCIFNLNIRLEIFSGSLSVVNEVNHSLWLQVCFKPFRSRNKIWYKSKTLSHIVSIILVLCTIPMNIQQKFKSKIMPTWEDSAPERVLETFKTSSSWAQTFLKSSNGEPRYWCCGQIWIKYLTEGCGEVLAPPGDTELQAAGVDSHHLPAPKEQASFFHLGTWFLR